MANLIEMPNALDVEKKTCKAIIETPKGRRSKFRYNPEYDLFELGSLMPQGLVFPFDFGFIPSTLGEDGDPLDVLILMDEPMHVGCLVDIRLIGVMEAEQTEKSGENVTNDRLIGIAVHSHQQADVNDIREISRQVMHEIEIFFATYNSERGKQFKMRSLRGPGRALKLLRAGINLFQSQSR